MLNVLEERSRERQDTPAALATLLGPELRISTPEVLRVLVDGVPIGAKRPPSRDVFGRAQEADSYAAFDVHKHILGVSNSSLRILCVSSAENGR